eukprot:scaffold7121_cov121-Isochrysis_galbana.AAC.9
MVQVVSMEEVPMMLGSVSFQSKDVSGAQNSADARRRGTQAPPLPGVPLHPIPPTTPFWTC